MQHYVVENSNGIPGITHMRYSVSTSNDSLVLNIVFKVDSTFNHKEVMLMDERFDSENPEKRTIFLSPHQPKEGRVGYSLVSYNGKKDEFRVQIPVSAKDFTHSLMRENHIKVTSWGSDVIWDGDLSIDLFFGKGLIEVQEVPEVPASVISGSEIIQMDFSSMTDEVALRMMRLAAQNNMVIRNAA